MAAQPKKTSVAIEQCGPTLDDLMSKLWSDDMRRSGKAADEIYENSLEEQSWVNGHVEVDDDL